VGSFKAQQLEQSDVGRWGESDLAGISGNEGVRWTHPLVLTYLAIIDGDLTSAVIYRGNEERRAESIVSPRGRGPMGPSPQRFHLYSEVGFLDCFTNCCYSGSVLASQRVGGVRSRCEILAVDPSAREHPHSSSE
jgi:hypothetical protein